MTPERIEQLYALLKRANFSVCEFLLLVLLLIIARSCQAAESGDTWITGSAKSYHGDREVKHNETNIGIGLESYLSPDLRIGLALMQNSFYKPSVQAYTMFTPWALGDWKLGAVGGFATGYGPWPEPVLMGAATWEGRRFGVDVVGLPPAGTFRGFVAVRFKFKWEGQ